MPPPYAAYLRVYEPLSALPAAEQAHWRRYVADGQAPAPSEAPRLERENALRRLVSGRLPDAGEQAMVAGGRAGADGPVRICPWRTSLRSWEAAETFAAGLAQVVVEAFLPAATERQARTELAAWRADRPQSRSHILTSTWEVPIRWFALFTGAERRLLVHPDRRELVFTTPMAQARRRAARALDRVRKGLGDVAVTASVEELARWLEDFHPRSLVELDYGGLVWLFSPEELADDDSAGDVTAALDALAAGDGAAAGAAYDRVVARWRPAQLGARSN